MQGILLVDHGSRRAESNAQLREVAELVGQRVGAAVPVEIAHMEIAKPNVTDGIEALVRRGVTEIVVVPYLLAPGRHAAEDIPSIAQEAVGQKQGVSVRVAECLGVDTVLADLVVRRARAAGLR